MSKRGYDYDMVMYLLAGSSVALACFLLFRFCSILLIIVGGGTQALFRHHMWTLKRECTTRTWTCKMQKLGLYIDNKQLRESVCRDYKHKFKILGVKEAPYKFAWSFACNDIPCGILLLTCL